MGDRSAPPLRRQQIIGAFNARAVEFLLVGGSAAQMWGAHRPTYDLDLCVRWTRENLDRVGQALTDLDAGMRVDGDPTPVSDRHDRRGAGPRREP
jgi:hypothetical protein